MIDGTASDSTLWPAWRKSIARWQWKQIGGTDLASVQPSPPVPGGLGARIDAWNGLAADANKSILFSAANGGHADYSGNEVYRINLSVDQPQWELLRGPTPAADILTSNHSLGVYNDYYRDGRPASTHTYYALNYLASRSAVFKFGAGSLWGTGNEANWKTDAFSVVSNDWVAAGTWPDAVQNLRSGVTGAAICMNPATDQVYVSTPGNLRRFDPAAGTFDVLDSWLDNSSSVYSRGCAVDPVRHRTVFFGDAYRPPSGGLVYDIGTNRFSRISFSGDGATAVAAAGYNFGWFEPKVDKFVVKTGTAGDVYSVDPVTFEASRIPTAGPDAPPDAANGVHSRWQRLPKLGGYAYYPRYGSGIWFFAVE